MPISIDPSTIYFPLRRLINKVFKLRQEDLLSRSIISISISKEELLANADFYNMVVPHCMARKLPFGKYYCVDSERITLTAFS